MGRALHGGACLLISGKVRNNMEFVVFTGVLLFYIFIHDRTGTYAGKK